MSSIYLDHNATTRVDPEVRRAMLRFLDEEFGNPSSIHAAGRAARDAIEQARREVARLCGGRADEIVFTSGGTEGDNLAVRGAARAARTADARRTRIVSSPLEHPAVAGALASLAGEGFAVTLLPVDAAGRIDPDELARALGDDVALVSLQLANHELGNLYPIAELASRARSAGAWFHTDAVQAAGKIPLQLATLGVDVATISAHKLHGPKGVGAIYLREGRVLSPHTVGGHQERERRPGTENVPGVVGFGVAARLAVDGGLARSAEISSLRDRLEAGARALGARVHGDLSSPASRVGNTSNLAWDGVEGELLVENLDLEGIAASTGAACTSGSLEPSPVILALGQARGRAREAVRFSLGRDNTASEIDRVLALLPSLLMRIRAA